MLLPKTKDNNLKEEKLILNHAFRGFCLYPFTSVDSKHFVRYYIIVVGAHVIEAIHVGTVRKQRKGI